MDENFSREDDEIVMAVLLDDDEEITVDIEHEEIYLDADLVEVVVEITQASDLEAVLEFEVAEGSNEQVEDAFLDLKDNDSDFDQVLVETFQERRQQKFIAQSRSKKQWSLITLSVIAIFMTLIFLVLESPAYDVDKVIVKNTSSESLTSAETKKIDPLVKKLETRPMYRLNADDVLSEIESMSTISSVSSSKSWPGTLTISIFRRVPAAYIETDKGIVLVDSQGFVYEKVSTIPAGLPSFDGIAEITFTKKINDETYVDVLKAAPKEIIKQIKQVRLEEGKYIVELSDGIDIILGDNKQLKEKLAISWSVILTKKRSELGYIDVSVPSLPVSGSPQLKV